MNSLRSLWTSFWKSLQKKRKPKYRIRAGVHDRLFIVDYYDNLLGMYMYLHGGFNTRQKAEHWLREQIEFDTQNPVSYIGVD
jgi:hypothetical protein